MRKTTQRRFVDSRGRLWIIPHDPRLRPELMATRRLKTLIKTTVAFALLAFAAKIAFGQSGDPVLLKGIGSATVATGAGAATAGTLRVIPASDSPTLTVSCTNCSAGGGSASTTVTPGTGTWNAGGSSVAVNGSTLAVVGLNGAAVVVNGTMSVVGMGGGAVSVTGPLTDTQLRASAVPISGALTDTQLRASAVPVSLPTVGSTFTVVGMNGAAIVVNGTMSVVGMSGGAVAVTLPTAGSTFTAVGMGGSAIVTNGTHSVVGMGGAAIVVNGTMSVVGMSGGAVAVSLPAAGSTFTVVGMGGAGVLSYGTMTVVGMGGAGIAVNDTPPTLTKGTQGSTGFSTQDLKDAGRTRVIFTIDASTISTAEGLITMARNVGGASTNSALYSVTSAKTLRCTGGVVTMTTTSTTVARTRVRFRENTGGSCATNSPIWFTADFGDYTGTLAAGDGYTYAVPFTIPDGVEFPASDSLCVTDTATTNTTGALSVTIWCFEY